MERRLDPPGILSPIRIATLAECLHSRHAVSAYCARCRRWAALDLERLVAVGYGDRMLAKCRPRCEVCRGPGQIQLRAPVPGWRGPAAHGGAQRSVVGVPADGPVDARSPSQVGAPHRSP